MKKLLIFVHLYTCILILLSGCSQTDQQNFQAILTALKQVNETQTKKLPGPEKSPQKPKPISTTPEIAKRISNSINPTDREIRFFGVTAAGESPGPYNIGQVCEIWYRVKENWKYVNDPRGFEYFAPAAETFWTHGGDCDDFAIFLSSLIEAIGGRTRIILTQDHAYCEVYIGDTQKKVDKIIHNIAQIDFDRNLQRDHKFHWHKDSAGYWLNLDWSADYPGGPFSQADRLIVVYPDGTFVEGPEKK